MYVQRLSDDIAKLQHTVGDLLGSFCYRLCNGLLLLLRHDTPLALLQLQIGRFHWRSHRGLRWRHAGIDERRVEVCKTCLLPLLTNLVQSRELLLELKQAFWPHILLGNVKPLNGLGLARAALPRLTYAITALCIDLVEVADWVLSLSDRVSSRLPIIHTTINILHVVRNFHELVIEFVLLDLKTTRVSTGEWDSGLEVGTAMDIFHHIFRFYEKVHPMQFRGTRLFILNEIGSL